MGEHKFEKLNTEVRFLTSAFFSRDQPIALQNLSIEASTFLEEGKRFRDSISAISSGKDYCPCVAPLL